MLKDEKIAKFEDAVSRLSTSLRYALMQVPDDVKKRAQEIRIRTNLPLVIVCGDSFLYVTRSGRTTHICGEGIIIPEKSEVEECFKIICGYSVHAHQSEMVNGYITLPGGHRAGICATANVENGEIAGVRNVSSLNLRIARQVTGAAAPLFNSVFSGGICGLLIAGAPASGKTTVLRDLARELSSAHMNRMIKTVIVDERGELAAVYNGQAQNALGVHCDVLDGYPKAKGIMIALRTLSPDVIICDEIGGEEDIKAIGEGMNAGVNFIATIHAASKKDLLARRQVREALLTGAFDKVALMCGRQTPGEIRKIYTAEELTDEICGAAHIGADGVFNRKAFFPKASSACKNSGADFAYAAID